MRIDFALPLLGLAALGSDAEGQQPRLPSPTAARSTAQRITSADMRSRMALLSNDCLRGRNTPSPECDPASTSVASDFRRLGLQPAGDSHGTWADPKNLGAPINAPGVEFAAHVTDHKRVPFYSRSDGTTRVDVHWVRFDSPLEALRKQ